MSEPWTDDDTAAARHLFERFGATKKQRDALAAAEARRWEEPTGWSRHIIWIPILCAVSGVLTVAIGLVRMFLGWLP